MRESVQKKSNGASTWLIIAPAFEMGRDSPTTTAMNAVFVSKIFFVK
jgi:hypothetical protein